MTLEDTRALSVDVATLRQWRDSSEHVELLDVRTAAEYEPGHIPAGFAQQLERQVPDVLSRLPYNRRSYSDIRAALDDLSGR